VEIWQNGFKTTDGLHEAKEDCKLLRTKLLANNGNLATNLKFGTKKFKMCNKFKIKTTQSRKQNKTSKHSFCMVH